MMSMFLEQSVLNLMDYYLVEFSMVYLSYFFECFFLLPSVIPH